MEIKFVVVRVSVRARNILHDVYRVVIQIDIVFAVGVRPNFHSADQLVVAVVEIDI